MGLGTSACVDTYLIIHPEPPLFRPVEPHSHRIVKRMLGIHYILNSPIRIMYITSLGVHGIRLHCQLSLLIARHYCSHQLSSQSLVR